MFEETFSSKTISLSVFGITMNAYAATRSGLSPGPIRNVVTTYAVALSTSRIDSTPNDKYSRPDPQALRQRKTVIKVNFQCGTKNCRVLHIQMIEPCLIPSADDEILEIRQLFHATVVTRKDDEGWMATWAGAGQSRRYSRPERKLGRIATSESDISFIYLRSTL